MAEAMRIVEGDNGVNPSVTGVRHIGYFNKVLNQEFVTLFVRHMGETHKLEEFVFAIDNLIDISRSPSFPSGKLLNNADITLRGSRAAFAFNQLARSTKDSAYYGCQVGPATAELIQEFFEHKYIKLISEFFIKSGFPFAVFTLDGVQFHLTLNRSFNMVRDYAALKLTVAGTGDEVYIPFLKSRLED